jgi:plastocyanin
MLIRASWLRCRTGVQGSSLRRELGSVEFLGAVLFVFCVAFPPFDDLGEVNLSIHMLQHVLIVASGFMIAYPMRNRPFFARIRGPRAGLGSLLLVCVLFAYWHFPGPWDSAVLNPLVHAAEHFTFLIGGLLIGGPMMDLSDSAKIGALLLAFFGHMGYAVILISPWNEQVYPLYSLAQQSVLGWILVTTGGVFLVGVAYILYRNPAWLQGAGFEATQRQRNRAPKAPTGMRGTVAPAVSFILLATLIGYFVATGIAIGSAPGAGPSETSVVYIAETPVSWQYSPQHIRVVVGVNNTVTWLSRSIAYDTVTGTNSSFASGPIAPGGSFSFTFTQPGTYGYRCLYHPWMTGSVTVAG